MKLTMAAFVRGQVDVALTRLCVEQRRTGSSPVLKVAYVVVQT